MTVSVRTCLNAAVKAGILAGLVFPVFMVPQMLVGPSPLQFMEAISSLAVAGVIASIFGFAAGLVVGFPCLLVLVHVGLARPVPVAIAGAIGGALALQRILPAKSSAVSDLWIGALTGILAGLLSLRFLKPHPPIPIRQEFKLPPTGSRSADE